MDKRDIIRESFKYNTHKLEPEKRYKLYATGDSDMNGRKYVALSSNTRNKKIQYHVKVSYLRID